MKLLHYLLLSSLFTGVWVTAYAQDCQALRQQYQCPAGDEKYPIHLSFDDGPADLTPLVLDVLRKEQIPATFFIIAERIDCEPMRQQCLTSGRSHSTDCEDYQLCLHRQNTIARIHQEGHMIGAHSYRHVRHSQIPDSQMRQYFHLTRQLLEPWMTTSPPMFRLPYGDGWFNRDEAPYVLETLKEHGFRHIAWEMSAYDWRESDQQGDRILRTVMNEICSKKQGLLLFHDGDAEKPHIGRTFTNTHLASWIPVMRCVADFKPLSYFYPDLQMIDQTQPNHALNQGGHYGYRYSARK